MPVALDVNREAVRVLVVAVGVREAARQMNLPAGTVLAWANRGGWLQSARDAIKRKTDAIAQSREQPGSTQSPAINPSDALQNTLAERKDQTRLNLSRYVVDASKKAAKSAGDLEIAPRVKEVAAVAGHVWPEVKGAEQGEGTLVLSIGGNVNLGGQHVHAAPDSGE